MIRNNNCKILAMRNQNSDVMSQMIEFLQVGLVTDTKEPDWSDYADMEPIDFIRQNFYIPETNSTMELYPGQIIPLTEALRRQNDGKFVYSTVVWSAIKKSAKSSIAAAVGLWFAWRKPWATVKVIANDLKQADSRVAYYMRRAILLHPVWSQVCKIQNYKIVLPNHSTIEAIPIDPKGEAGGNDDFVIYSELWGWKNKASLKLWTESTLSPVKMGESMRWCETYAGESGEAPVLEMLYQQTVKEGICVNEEYEMYNSASGKTFCLWNTRPTLPFQTEDYYAQEKEILTPNEFDRVHHNQWSSSTNAFCPIEWFDASARDIREFDSLRFGGKPDLWKEKDSIVVAADAAVDNDNFGVVALSGAGDGDNLIVRFARKWAPPLGGKIKYRTADGDGPEDYLRWLFENFNVIEMAYDPYQLEDMASRLRDDLVCHLYEFQQTGERAIADRALYDMIKGSRIWHDGGFVDLREHIANANRKTEGENKMRIIKRSQNLKIDLAVCLSMAASRANYWQI